MVHSRWIFKAYIELPIQALARKAVELAKLELQDMEQVSKEDAVTYDSMSNGGKELSMRLLRGLFRTVKL